MNEDALSLSVPSEAEGGRLDRFLADRIPDRTRSAVRRMIGDGRVLIDGTAASKPGLTVRSGMRIEVHFPPPPEGGPVPEQIPLDVVHEDADLIVIDKSAGLVVHAGHGRSSGTLVNALLGRGTPLSPVGAPERPGIVHRLDLGTSGLLVVAKTEPAHRSLARAFSRHEVFKRYVALVWGHPDPAEGTIERSIGRSRSHPLKMSVGRTRGRPRHAASRYRTLESWPGFALVEVLPVTGRTHQIRVHMQSIHHPVVGDERYGGRAWRGVQEPLRRKALREFGRLGLHAAELAFVHPASGVQVRFKAPLPAGFEALLDVLRRD